jgi:hypothetical protein
VDSIQRSLVLLHILLLREHVTSLLWKIRSVKKTCNNSYLTQYEMKIVEFIVTENFRAHSLKYKIGLQRLFLFSYRILQLYVMLQFLKLHFCFRLKYAMNLKVRS